MQRHRLTEQMFRYQGGNRGVELIERLGLTYIHYRESLMDEELAFIAGDTEDVVSIPGSGRSLGERNHSSILAWEIPWTEEPGRLQSTKSCKELDMTE